LWREERDRDGGGRADGNGEGSSMPRRKSRLEESLARLFGFLLAKESKECFQPSKAFGLELKIACEVLLQKKLYM
jgi:hypothetical protein